MISANYKKTLALIGITAILAPGLFFAFPRKAKALVPVIDAAVVAELTTLNTSSAATAVSTGALVKKEYILDGLLTALAKPLLRALTDSIVQWIRSGFQGQPLFITNFETHLADAADQATGRFMKEYLSPEAYNLLCSPWRFQTQLLLKRVSSTRLQRQRCTLNTVLANAENGITFGAALRRGSWEDWMGVALNPQNNPHGALLSQYNKLLGEQNKAKDKAKTESVSNQGFLSMRECVEYYPLTAEESFYLAEPVCKRYENSSPGKWIQTQLSSATGIDFHEIALADEINEIIGALISSMLSTVLQGGVLRLR